MKIIRSLPVGIIFVAIAICVILFLGWPIELTLASTGPSGFNTLTPFTQEAPDSIGSYDILGRAIACSSKLVLKLGF